MIEERKTMIGFTLIEMIVVIFVVSIGLIGVLSFFNINMNSQLEAKNELIASGLAQEGTDIIRNVVDSNYLNGYNWYQEIYNPPNDNNYCTYIDRDALLDPVYKLKCKSNPSKKIEICFKDGYYYHCSNSSAHDKTIFSRKIEITVADNFPFATIDLNSGDCLNVTTTVTWPGRSTAAKDIICKPRR